MILPAIRARLRHGSFLFRRSRGVAPVLLQLLIAIGLLAGASQAAAGSERLGSSAAVATTPADGSSELPLGANGATRKSGAFSRHTATTGAVEALRRKPQKAQVQQSTSPPVAAAAASCAAPAAPAGRLWPGAQWTDLDHRPCRPFVPQAPPS